MICVEEDEGLRRGKGRPTRSAVDSPTPPAEPRRHPSVAAARRGLGTRGLRVLFPRFCLVFSF